jgi:hypothetical protein
VTVYEEKKLNSTSWEKCGIPQPDSINVKIILKLKENLKRKEMANAQSACG